MRNIKYYGEGKNNIIYYHFPCLAFSHIFFLGFFGLCACVQIADDFNAFWLYGIKMRTNDHKRFFCLTLRGISKMVQEDIPQK